MSKQTQAFRNTLYTHDNLCVLCGLDSVLVDLVYLDTLAANCPALAANI